MRNARSFVCLLCVLALAFTAAAQMGAPVQIPNIFGLWSPEVGSGSAYEIQDKDGTKKQFEMTVIGREEVNGKPGFWMEIGMTNPKTNGPVYIKYLMAPGQTETSAVLFKMIMMMPGQPQPIEIDMNSGPMAAAMAGRAGASAPKDIRDKGEMVGTETITVPGGTFSCQHWRAKDGTGDVWVSSKVGPWGLVKMQGKDSAVILTRLITDAKDHITGTPISMQQMMQQMGRRQ